MKFVFLLSLIIAALVACQVKAGTPCTSQDQCAADECCQIVNMIVASKRQVMLPVGGFNTQGTCEKYKQQGQSCSSIAVMNGYCGCAPGLTCKAIDFSHLGPHVRRMELPATCEVN